MDGVLVDSERYICEAAVQMFSELGLMVSPDDFQAFVGTGENRYLGGVAELYGFKLDIEKAKKRTYEIYGKIARGRLLAFPGSFEFLDMCREKKFSLALATSADKLKVEINLRELNIEDDTFDVVISGDMLENKKPNPEIFLKAAAELGLEPCDCMVVEDAVNGVLAAKAAGMTCMALTTTFSRDELDEAGADWIFENLASVPVDMFKE